MWILVIWHRSASYRIGYIAIPLSTLFRAVGVEVCHGPKTTSCRAPVAHKTENSGTLCHLKTIMHLKNSTPKNCVLHGR